MVRVAWPEYQHPHAEERLQKSASSKAKGLRAERVSVETGLMWILLPRPKDLGNQDLCPGLWGLSELKLGPVEPNHRHVPVL